MIAIRKRIGQVFALDFCKKWLRAQRVKREDRRALQHQLDELDRQAHPRALRHQELDKAMEQLLKKHMVADSLDELYTYISLYVGCNTSKEDYDYCKHVLKEKALKGMSRYDDERLR
jgi:hypothetical protein